MITLAEIIARWDSGEGKPYKGSLIDWDSYGGDGVAPPSDIGCMCAQGQVLHLLGGWAPWRLFEEDQAVADGEAARLLGISRAHAVLLRKVNDTVDGAPSVVLTHPERILGDQTMAVLAFWRHLDAMTRCDWAAAMAATQEAAWAADAARVATQGATQEAAWAADLEAAQAARAAARDAARDAAWDAAQDAARDAAGDAAWDAGWDAGWATNEIQGAAVMRERGTPFFFLPLFGFASPEDVLARYGGGQ